jgi:hypothetical protein
MLAPRKFLDWRLVEGASCSRDGITITPLARILTVRWPGGGIHWRT